MQNTIILNKTQYSHILDLDTYLTIYIQDVPVNFAKIRIVILAVSKIVLLQVARQLFI